MSGVTIGPVQIDEDDQIIIDWDLLRETIRDRCKLDDTWEWVRIRGEEAGYWSCALPNDYELAIEPGFFGYVEVAVYDPKKLLVMPRKIRLVLP